MRVELGEEKIHPVLLISESEEESTLLLIIRSPSQGLWQGNTFMLSGKLTHQTVQREGVFMTSHAF